VYETASSEENLVDSNKDNKPDKKHELEHKDPNDKAQTVVVKEEDQVVDKGNKLTVTDKDSPKVEINAPKTGDINNITGVIVSLVISILGMTTLVLRYRKN
jgi:LPXTG-motif cell wall-anchored protein